MTKPSEITSFDDLYSRIDAYHHHEKTDWSSNWGAPKDMEADGADWLWKLVIEGTNAPEWKRQEGRWRKTPTSSPLEDHVRSNVADRIKKGGRGGDVGDAIVFRGQSDSKYGLVHSLFRATTSDRKIDSPRLYERDLQKAEQAVIDGVRESGLGKGLSDLELLSVMQHHRHPTRLLDVSLTPMEALYFACNEDPDRDGLLYAIWLNEGHENAISDFWGPQDLHGSFEKNLQDGKLPWQGLYNGRNQPAEWKSGVSLIKDLGTLDPRMAAQNGVFLVSPIYANIGDNYWNDVTVDIPNSHTQYLSNLPLRPAQTNKHALPKDCPGLVYWLVVRKEWKPQLLRLLKDAGVTRETMYPEFPEAALLAKELARRPL